MAEQGNGSPLTPEQYKLAVQLESIFMPHARRHRIAAGFGENESHTPIRFVHYTSAEAALSIIRSKRLWMRNATCMADFREVHHGVDMLRGVFSDVERRGRFLNGLDQTHDGVGRDAINLFDQWMSDVLLETYIASISEHDDNEDTNGRLSMWRAFGSSPGRVAFVLRIPKLSGAALALNLLFSPIAYLTEIEVHNVFSEITENIEKNREFLRSVDRQVVLDTILITFQAAAVCLKHEGFKEEREWRAIYSPTLRPSSLMETTLEVIGAVPQRIYKVPIDSRVSPSLAGLDLVDIFDRLIIGPSPYPWAMYKAFVAALSEAGCSKVDDRVLVSNIPIRS